MPRISCSEMTTYRWSFEEDVSGYLAAGVGAVGLWLRKLSEFGEERGIEYLNESGLAVTSLSCAGGFTGADGQTFREAVSDALDAVQLASSLRAGCLVVVTGGRAGHTANHARRIVVEALRMLGDAGAALGVQIAVQPLLRQPNERCSFLTSLSSTVDLVEFCGHSHVGLVLDLSRSGAAVQGSRNTRPSLAALAKHVKLATLCEPPSLACAGENGQALGAAIGQLELAGYRGGYELQVLCETSWNSDYLQLLVNYRETLEEICPAAFEVQPPTAVPPGVAASTAATLN